MGQRHKHADVIIAWANGAEIEALSSADRGWLVTRNPTWSEDVEYRVKPPPKKYRVALFRLPGEAASAYTACTNTQEAADGCEQHGRFVRWLTDWIEYEE